MLADGLACEAMCYLHTTSTSSTTSPASSSLSMAMEAPRPAQEESSARASGCGWRPPARLGSSEPRIVIDGCVCHVCSTFAYLLHGAAPCLKLLRVSSCFPLPVHDILDDCLPTPCDNNRCVPRHRASLPRSCFRSSPHASVAPLRYPSCRRRLSLPVPTAVTRSSRCGMFSTMAHTSTQTCTGGWMFLSRRQYGWPPMRIQPTASQCHGCASSPRP